MLLENKRLIATQVDKKRMLKFKSANTFTYLEPKKLKY